MRFDWVYIIVFFSLSDHTGLRDAIRPAMSRMENPFSRELKVVHAGEDHQREGNGLMSEWW